MQTWKKTLSGILSAAMLLSMCTVGVSAEEQGTENSSVVEPTVENPSVVEPGAPEPGEEEPGEENPSAPEPGEENLNTMNLSTVNLTEPGTTEPSATTASVNNFDALKAAVENANVNEITLTGDIAIAAGPANNLVLDRAITINGAGHTLTKTFNTVDVSGYGDYEEVFEIRSSGVTISNVKIAGLAGGMKDEAAIYVAASGTSNAPIVIEKCTFSGENDDSTSPGGSGIISQAGCGAYLEVKNNTFTNVKHGMWFNGISDATISSNTLNGVRYTGIWVEQNSSNIQITNNKMTDVAFENYSTNAPEFACGIYVNDGCTGINLSGNNITLHADATNGAQIVAPGYDPFTPTVDLSPSRGVTLSGHTFSGNVDPRTFTVTDNNIHTLFESILEGDANPWTIANDKKLTFGALEFGGLNANKFYTVQQINPALTYAYSETDFPNNTKTKTYQGKDLQEGLYFMISAQADATSESRDISFKIAQATDANTNADLTDAPTYTFTNEVTFESSDEPGDTVIEVNPSVDTDASGTVTAKAEVLQSDVTAAVEGADTNTTVEIVATTDDNSVEKAEIKLDSTAVSTLVDTTGDDPTAKVKDVAIKTDVGTITLSSSALEKIAGNTNVTSNGMTLEVEQETPSGSEVAVISVTVKSNNTNVPLSDLEEPITISFFIGTNLQNPVLLYKAQDGTLSNIESSTYDPVTGIITGTTRHLSAFAAIAPSAIEDGGIGKKVTLTPGKTGDYLTIQVTKGGANSIYTVKATADVVIYVTTGTVLSVWETKSAPTFDEGGFAPNGNPAILADRQTIS